MPTTIQKLISIQCAGVFSTYRASSALADFQKRNLIYGFNGTGKTTLSRLLASLAAGTLDEALQSTTKFSVKFDDGTIVTEQSLSALNGRLLIYNGDFVARSFRWAEGEAEPVFYLGKQQADISKELEEAKTALEGFANKLVQSTTLRDTHKRAFETFKSDTARDINASTRPATQYRANNLDTDYAAAKYDDSRLVSPELLGQLAALLGQTQARAKVASKLPGPALDLSDLSNGLATLLGQTAGALVLKDLAVHDAMVGWVKTGLDYHSAHDLDHCLFCGNALTIERLDALKGMLANKLAQLMSNIDTLFGKLQSTSRSTSDLKSSIPVKDQLDPAVQAEYEPIRSGLISLIGEALDLIGKLTTALTEKKQSPNRVLALDAGIIQNINAWNGSWLNAINGFASSAQKHNDLQDSFENQKDGARKQLKVHYLAQNQSRYSELAQAAADAAAAHTESEKQLRAHQTKIQELEQGLRNHGPAADLINGMIASFLGHSEIAIKAANAGYKLVRKSGAVLGHLSEGEKTAITICYFLTLTEADGRKPADLIVVIDDPISSLDTRALNYAFNLLKSRLGNVAQLFILTHNLHFMNEAKKWIKPSRKEQEQGVEPALFFLDCRQVGDPATRQTSLVKMPKLLREYESEYQFMFSLVHRATTQEAFSDQLFLLPNAMRKVLEVFVAFKVPGSSGLSSSLDSDAIKASGIDAARLRSLERLSALESHGDSLDDLVTMSPMTVEETKEAATILFELIQTLDPIHYNQMCSLCR